MDIEIQRKKKQSMGWEEKLAFQLVFGTEK